MKRTVRQKEVNIKPVQKIELDEKNIILKTVAVVAMIVIAATAFGFGIYQLVKGKPEWTTVKYIMNEDNCSGDLYFQYHVSGKKETSRVEAQYSVLCNDVYRYFSKDDEYTDIGNICTINRNPNTECRISDVLYDALKTVADVDATYLYFGPIYSELEALCLSENDSEASQFDPVKSAGEKEYYEKITDFATSGHDIELVFLGENRVKLLVSQEYLEFSKSMGNIDFISFGWMRNAFVVDHVADEMIKAGYTEGCISSYDGFIRCLDNGKNEYAITLYKRAGKDIVFDRVLNYNSARSFVLYRDYPLTDPDAIHYYTYSDGRTVVPYLNRKGTEPEGAPNTMCCYSDSCHCSEILKSTMRVFLENEVTINANDITMIISE